MVREEQVDFYWFYTLKATIGRGYGFFNEYLGYLRQLCEHSIMLTI